MPAHDPGDPWPGATYHGFAGRDDHASPPARRWLRPALMTFAGLAAAVLLGVAFGFLARPTLAVRGAAPVAPAAEDAAQSVSAAKAAALADSVGEALPQDADVAPDEAAPPTRDVPIKVKPAPKPAPLHSNGRLQVLPPRMAHAAAPAATPRPVRTGPPPQPPAGSGPFFAAATPDDAPVAAIAVAPPAVVATPPPEPAAVHPRASFDCATARPGAEQMICADPALAAQDRTMQSAYKRALRASDTPEDLRSEQRDWMAMREDAARRSPQAVASLYNQRIRDLNAIAADDDDRPDDADGAAGQ